MNNLLSRDDEGEADDDDNQESYMPDDLISLLDGGGMHADHPSVIIDADTMFNEEMFGYSTLRTRGSGTRSRLGTFPGFSLNFVMIILKTCYKKVCACLDFFKKLLDTILT